MKGEIVVSMSGLAKAQSASSPMPVNVLVGRVEVDQGVKGGDLVADRCLCPHSLRDLLEDGAASVPDGVGALGRNRFDHLAHVGQAYELAQHKRPPLSGGERM